MVYENRKNQGSGLVSHSDTRCTTSSGQCQPMAGPTRPVMGIRGARNTDTGFRSNSTRSRAWYIVLSVFILNQPSVTVAAKCEPIKVLRCKGMPWNLTHMPNLVHHSSQENAELVLSQFKVLLNMKCSMYLEFFLCSMFTPMCFHHEGEFPKIVPPCRKICAHARDNCEPIMLKYNVTWPEQLFCENLPEYHRGMCITPDAFIDQPKPSCSAAAPVKCKKCKRMRLKDKTFAEKKYDFVIRAKIEKIITAPCNAQVKVNVTEVMKRNAVMIETGPNILVFNGSCACPKLRRGKEYALGGHEDVTTGEIKLDRESMAEKWGKRAEKKLKKWLKKRQKMPLNRRRRTNESTAPPRKDAGDATEKTRESKRSRRKKSKKSGPKK